MSAPFQPGDVVVCVDDSPDTRGNMVVARFLRRLAIYRVEWCGLTTVGVWGVQLFGDPSTRSGAWAADRFRKIDDDVTEDFREQMRSLGKGKSVVNPSHHSQERVA